MKSNSSRLAGALYLVPTLVAPFSLMFVPAQVLVVGDAAATAGRLLAHAQMFRFGMAADLLIALAEVALTAVLYRMFREAGRTLALVSAAARFLMAGVQAGNVAFSIAALHFAPRAPGAALDALVLHAQALHAWEALFALHCLTLAVLVVRTGHGRMGAALAMAGMGYGLNAFGCLVFPSAAPVLAGVVGFGALFGEVPFVVWLLLGRGVQSTASDSASRP